MKNVPAPSDEVPRRVGRRDFHRIVFASVGCLALIAPVALQTLRRWNRERVEIRIDGKPSFYGGAKLELDGPSDIVKPLRLTYIPGHDLADAFIAFDFPQYETQPPITVNLTLLDDRGATLSKQQHTVVDYRAKLREMNMSGDPSPSIPAYHPVELTTRFQFSAEIFPKIGAAVIAFERN